MNCSAPHEGNGATPQPPKKLQLTASVDRKTMRVQLTSNQDPVVLSVKDLADFMTSVYRNTGLYKPPNRIVSPYDN